MRVIAGALRGRRLVAPRGLETRPTSDRVREALFSSLGHVVIGARVLDLYAGTGALGIESISRGATHATFVESAAPALEALRKNVAELGLATRTAIVAKEVARAAPSLKGPFSLVFIDPPYAAIGAIAPLVAGLVVTIAPEATLVLEHATRDAPPALAGFEARPPRAYGDTSLSIFTRRPIISPTI